MVTPFQNLFLGCYFYSANKPQRCNKGVNSERLGSNLDGG